MLVALVPSACNFGDVLDSGEASSLSSAVDVFPFFSVTVVFGCFTRGIATGGQSDFRGPVVSSGVLGGGNLPAALSQCFGRGTVVFPGVFNSFGVSLCLYALIVGGSQN